MFKQRRLRKLSVKAQKVKAEVLAIRQIINGCTEGVPQYYADCLIRKEGEHAALAEEINQLTD